VRPFLSVNSIHTIEADPVEPRMRVIDVVKFVAERILPDIPVHERRTSDLLVETWHPSRLSTSAGTIAETVIIPDDWGC
jgi:hypothetical protein